MTTPSSKTMTIRAQLFSAFGGILVLVSVFGIFAYQAIQNVKLNALRIAEIAAEHAESAETVQLITERLSVTTESGDAAIFVCVIGMIIAALGLAALLSWTLPSAILEPIRTAADQLSGTAGGQSFSKHARAA